MEEHKRGVGRPKKPDRKQRINVTLSPDTLHELEVRIPEKQRSAYIEKLIRKDLKSEDVPMNKTDTIQATVYYYQRPWSNVTVTFNPGSTTTGKALIDGRTRNVVYRARTQGKNKGSMQWHCDDY